MTPIDPTDATANLGVGGSAYIPPVLSGGATRASTPASNEPVSSTAASAPTGEGRYTPGDELGRGGWGHVEQARDHQLERDVAIKRINRELGHATAIHERFLHEARVTGQLQHPGIVPVHELGVGEDGAPYYVMKLLEGATFKETIRATHSDPNGLPDGFSIDLLERFIAIANAVAYAHQQGVVHRDLKPSNVMVGRFGETIVVDWGLANHVDAWDETSPQEPLSEPPRSSGGSRSATATGRGAVLGTPAYMSPEQSLGDSETLGPATDVYALGVILYEVLTGANPFGSDSVETTLTLVREGRYRPPREINRRVPRALAAICTTAMAHDPADRYERAEQIVEDLQRFLVGEAVSVHDEPWWTPALRWCRRHPALTSGVFGSLAVLLVASTVFGAIIHRAYRAEQQARAEALERLAESREAGDAWLIGLSGSLQFFPGMEGLRGRLIDDAATHYAGLANELQSQGDDAPTQLELARCHLRLGDLHRLADRPDDSRRHYRLALSTFDQDGEALSWETRLESVNARIGLAMLDGFDRGALRSSLTEEAWLLGQLATTEVSGNRERRHRVANTLSRLALAFTRSDVGDAPEQIDRLVEAEGRAEYLVADRNEPRDHQLLQTVRDELCPLLRQEGRLAEAERLWLAETKRLEAFTQEQPDRPDLLQSLAFARMRLAGLRADSHHDHQAATGYRQAIDDLQRAWSLTDADAYYRRNVGVSLANLARSLPDDEVAEARLHEAMSELRAAVEATGPSAEDLARLADCYASLGRLSARRRDEGTLDFFDSAERCFAVLADHQPLSDRHRVALARCLGERASCRIDRGETGPARTDLQRADDLLLELTTTDLEVKTAAERLANQLRFCRAELLEAEGAVAAADTVRGEALTRLRELAQQEQAPPHRGRYPEAMQTLVDRLLERHDSDAGDWAEADRWLHKMAEVSPACTTVAPWRQRRALVYWRRGETDRAIILARSAEEASPGDPLTRALLIALGDAEDNELIAIRDATPGDRRLRFWIEQWLAAEDTQPAQPSQGPRR
ncbi:Serine/threonine-protein kinase PknD [Planctomycetes bacterium MalM25]|nr:Serine/threonine-protein kinase PknD [Planctomycetes bacterium MalM25]